IQRHSTFHSLFLRPTLIPLFFLATDLAGQNQPIVAVRATVPIVIDGRLDESVWQRPGMDQHIQRQPNEGQPASERDRKSTRLNSSHGYSSYAVFCFKKESANDLYPSSDFLRHCYELLLLDC